MENSEGLIKGKKSEALQWHQEKKAKDPDAQLLTSLVI